MDKPRAAQLFEQAYMTGLAPACVNLGVMLKKGDGVPKDAARAVELFKQACSAGVADAC